MQWAARINNALEEGRFELLLRMRDASGKIVAPDNRSGLDAAKICFEITETAAIASFSQANRFIQALKELGCKFALDDLGTGLS